MKLVNATFGLSVEFEENTPVEIVIENISSYRSFIEELYMQTNGGEGAFILSEKNKDQKISKLMDIVINPFSVNMNDRKVISVLYNNLAGIGNEMTEKKNMLASDMILLLDEIISKEQYSNIEYNFDYDWNDFFKLFNVRIGEEYESLLEKYVEYIKVISSLTTIQILCFVGLSQYFRGQELEELIKQANYSKVQLVFIESADNLQCKGGKRFIIDKDNCIIYA